MLADEHPERGYCGPQSLGGSASGIMLYVESVDRVFDRAIKAGATSREPVKDQFYGDRTGTLVDPFGHWCGPSQRTSRTSPSKKCSDACRR